MKEQIDKSCILHLNYWRELMESVPEITKLEKMGEKITYETKRIASIFEEIIEIYPNNLKSLVLYGSYLKFILNETE